MASETNQAYQRIDTSRLDGPSAAAPDKPETGAEARGSFGVRWFVIPLSVLLCVTQAVLTVLGANKSNTVLTGTLISVMAFAVLFLVVMVLNPLLRAAFREKILRPMNRAELMCIFTALLVTSGISTFGLSAQLVPLVATPWNPDWNTAQRGWNEDVIPHLNRSLFIDVPEDASPEEKEQAKGAINAFFEGVRPTKPNGEVIAQPPEYAPLYEPGPGYGKAEYWFAAFKAIPWGAWLGPLGFWLIFVGACYAMFYSLTYVVLEYWVRREKIIFPLAQLPEQLMPEDGSRRWLPWTVTRTGFWVAFAISFLVLSWNGAIAAEWVPGMNRIALGMGHSTVRTILEDSAFEGLTGGDMRLVFLIIFTAIGIAFLLPTEISFSLWFYFLVGKFMILALIWFGYGQTGNDFPTNWNTVNNTVTAQGGGGLLMFAGISLARAMVDYVRHARGKPLGQKLRLSIPMIGLAVSLLVMWVWLMWNGLPLIWALVVTAFLTLLTLGLMRVVAEGGVYWFQIHTSPLHLYNVFGLGKVLKASALVPLMPIYSVLFLDVKTFLAPNLPNAAKMQDDVGKARRTFHVNIILCIVVSVITAVGFAVFLAHLDGAQQMNRWFYTSATPSLMDRAQRLVTAVPEVDGGNVFSYVFGGGWVMLTMFLRRTLFWFPHPIGYVMMLNPLMRNMWFSFFLGWIAKKMVVKYGGKQTFDQARPIFIGLIMGEIIAITLWTVLGLSLGFDSGIDLNRLRP